MKSSESYCVQCSLLSFNEVPLQTPLSRLLNTIFSGCFDRFHDRPSSSMLAYVPGDNLIVEVVDNGETQAQATYKEFFAVCTPQHVGMLLYYSAFMLLFFHLTNLSVRAQKIIFTH